MIYRLLKKEITQYCFLLMSAHKIRWKIRINKMNNIKNK